MATLHDHRSGDEPSVQGGGLVDLAEHVLTVLGLERALVDLTLVDPARMTELNVAHMGGDGPTDVLAFPIDGPELLSERVGLIEAGGEVVTSHRWQAPEGPPAVLGDVVLCPGVAARQAAGAGHGLDDELRLLTVHGLLHLLGHDHADPDERQVMFALTDVLLARGERAAR